MPKYTYQSITVKKDWLLGNVAIKAVEVAQKHKQKLAHGEFYPQWKWDDNLDGVYFKTKSTKSKDKNIFVEFQASDN